MKTLLITISILFMGIISFAQGGYYAGGEYPVYTYKEETDKGYILRYYRDYPNSGQVLFKYEYYNKEDFKYQEMQALSFDGDSTIYVKTFNRLGELRSYRGMTVDVKGAYVKYYIREVRVLDENDNLASYNLHDFYDVENDFINHANGYKSSTESSGGELITKSQATQIGLDESINVQEHYDRIRNDAMEFYSKYFGSEEE